MAQTGKRFIPTRHKTSCLQMRFSGSGARNSSPGGRKKWRTISEDATDDIAYSVCSIQWPLRGADGRSAEEASFGPRRRKRLPARGRFPRHRYDRASRPGNGIVEYDNPDRYRSADEEKTRVQRKKSD